MRKYSSALRVVVLKFKIVFLKYANGAASALRN